MDNTPEDILVATAVVVVAAVVDWAKPVALPLLVVVVVEDSGPCLECTADMVIVDDTCIVPLVLPAVDIDSDNALLPETEPMEAVDADRSSCLTGA